MKAVSGNFSVKILYNSSELLIVFTMANLLAVGLAKWSFAIIPAKSSMLSFYAIRVLSILIRLSTQNQRSLSFANSIIIGSYFGL